MIEVHITGPDFARIMAVQDGYSFELDERDNLHVYTEKDNCALVVRSGFWSYVRDLDPDAAEE